MKLTTIRVTKLVLYESCPYCFYLSQTGVKEQDSDYLKLGTRVHKALEEYHQGKFKFTPEMKPFVDAYAKEYNPEVGEGLLEYEFKVPLFDTGIELTGHIDRIAHDWIHEHKTSASKYTQQQVDDHFQSTMYAYGYRQVFKKPELGIRVNVLVKNKVPILQPLNTFRTDDDLVLVEERVKKILAGIEADKFDPKSGRGHFYSICPMSL